jgi:cytochrome c oxidase subunit 2
MKVDLYEKIWMWAVGVTLVVFFATLANASIRHGFHPPSHVETIDPRAVFKSDRFRQQGVTVDSAGAVHATVIGLTFTWMPKEMSLPAATPITFHLTSIDVNHGYQIVRTNGQSMLIPGYISQFTTTFAQPGEYLVACNEYCGVGHHEMYGKLIVVPKEQWIPPSGSIATGTTRDTARGPHAIH